MEDHPICLAMREGEPGIMNPNTGQRGALIGCSLSLHPTFARAWPTLPDLCSSPEPAINWGQAEAELATSAL
jgi:hypothetical protein